MPLNVQLFKNVKYPKKNITSDHTITDTLQDANLRKAFMQFTILDKSYDNYLFWEKVQQYKKLSNPKKRSQLGHEICFTILDPSGKHSVNLSEKQIQKVQKEYEKNKENPPVELFDELFLEVKHVLSDSHKRFIDSFPKCT